MADQPGPSFGLLLRRLRAEAGLTQEELATAARLSPRTISDLERGVSASPRGPTARLLADGLCLEGTARRVFEAAARGRVSAGSEGTAAASRAVVLRMLPRDVAAFTGREAELERLAGMVAEAAQGGVVQICAIGGMAG